MASQQIHPQIGQSVMASLQGPQLLPVQALLTPLLNEIATLGQRTILILNDYHVITAPANNGVAFLLEHLPQQLHL